MAGAEAARAVSGAASIGRYFTVVSLVPSTVLVSYLTLLVNSGAWSGPDVRFSAAVDGLDLRTGVLAGIASLLFALAVHPLGFAIIQIFEGYWGMSRAGRVAAAALIGRHQRRARGLRLLTRDSLAWTTEIDRGEHPGESVTTPDGVLGSVASNESGRLNDYYPPLARDVMPTRLGNVLRRYERLAGKPFGMEAVTVVPRLLQVAPSRDVDYVQNQRIQLELALRTSLLGLVATVVTLAFMWRHGPWLLLALGPYLVSYAAYRGAVEIAHEYGTALAVLIELNRFALYERLHEPLPGRLDEERRLNAGLQWFMSLRNVGARLDADSPPVLRYRHPPGGPPSPGPDRGPSPG